MFKLVRCSPDATGRAVHIGKIASGEIEDEDEVLASAAAQLKRLGGKTRSANMPPERHREIAQAAARNST